MGDDRPPDFYLSSGEQGGGWEIARACWRMERLRGPHDAEYLLIRVDPPAPNRKSEEPIAKLIVSPHYRGATLFPVNKWPLPVYIYRILDYDCLYKEEIHSSDVITDAWGELYQTLQEAQKVANSGKKPGLPYLS